MSRRDPLIAITGLMALLAAAGVLDGTTGLMMVAPFFTLVGFLLAGLYPGERVLVELTRAFSARRRTFRPVSVSLPIAAEIFRPYLIAAVNGSRGPPPIA